MSTQELRQALVHDLAREFEEMGKDLGKIRLQKLVYFLQEAWAVPTRYRFKMYHYGPYSSDLETDTSRLKFAGYVKVQPDPQGYGFRITPDDEPQEGWSRLLRPHRQAIGSAIDTFGRRTTSELELAATIHFLRNIKPGTPTDELLRNVRALKPKFGEGYVSRVHAELDKLCP